MIGPNGTPSSIWAVFVKMSLERPEFGRSNFKQSVDVKWGDYAED